MRNETVRRVYLGGKIETAARPERIRNDRVPLLDVRGLGVLYGKATALDDVSIHVGKGEFVSVVGLNGAGKTTLFNAISGLVPYSGSINWHGGTLAGKTPGAIARGGIVQCPETRELFWRHVGAGKTSTLAASICRSKRRRGSLTGCSGCFRS